MKTPRGARDKNWEIKKKKLKNKKLRDPRNYSQADW